MATLNLTKKSKRRTNSLDPTVFFFEEDSKDTPTSFRGWGEIEKASLYSPFTLKANLATFPKENQIEKQCRLRDSKSSKILPASLARKSLMKSSTSPNLSKPSTSIPLKKRAQINTTPRHDYIPQTKPPKKPQQPIQKEIRVRPLSSYPLEFSLPQDESLGQERKRERFFFSKVNSEKIARFVRIKNQVREVNLLPQEIPSNENAPKSTERYNSELSPDTFAPYISSIRRSSAQVSERVNTASPDFRLNSPPKTIKKRMPMGCFQALLSSKSNVIRKTYMGISRLTTENLSSSQRNSIYDTGYSSLFNNDSMTSIDDKYSSPPRKYIHKLRFSQKNENNGKIGERSSTPIQPNSLQENQVLKAAKQQSGKELKNLNMVFEVEKKKSVRIGLKSDQKALLDKLLKSKIQSQRRRPKINLQNNIHTGELCIRPFHTEQCEIKAEL